MNCNSRSTEGSIDAQTSQRCFGSLYCIVDRDFHSIMTILWSRREARRSWTFSGIRKSCLKAFLVAFRLCSGPSEILQSQFPRGNPYVHLKESQHKKSTKTLSQHKIWRTPPHPPSLSVHVRDHKITGFLMYGSPMIHPMKFASQQRKISTNEK